ncbi:RNA polymerase subunit sigma-70 [Nocardia violaceofusca]|uniref:RNA polymerase subunit sigma-70 n=1 Tax=Nocardia violaceofusca TaxID=941182 RepID=UPI0007A4D552|nr:RNA polymerase subunit sigma-70 [Nocardia violaceofusca]
MTESSMAPGVDEQTFRELTEPYRAELRTHCYRMLGSMYDAEDALQETLLAAWRGMAEFQQRSSMRTWLYRIATNRCLNVRRSALRRPVAPLPFDAPEPTRHGEVSWLQPCPDALLDPQQVLTARASVELAFIALLQQLPPRQAAVLVLRDVLEFSAAEVAGLLGLTPVAVKAALQRARERLARHGGGRPEPKPGSPAERGLSERFARAFEAADVGAVVELLTDEAWLTMPPWPHEYHGRAAIGEFLRGIPAFRDRAEIRLQSVRANAHPAFGCYSRRADGSFRATGLLVTTHGPDGISALAHFPPADNFPRFGLPLALPPGGATIS